MIRIVLELRTAGTLQQPPPPVPRHIGLNSDNNNNNKNNSNDNNSNNSNNNSNKTELSELQHSLNLKRLVQKRPK